ncbi:MAG: hypothetical protein U1F21_11585 [Sphaerotilus natans]
MLSGSVPKCPRRCCSSSRSAAALVAIVGAEPVMRALRIRRVSEREFRTERCCSTPSRRALEGFASPSTFAF